MRRIRIWKREKQDVYKRQEKLQIAKQFAEDHPEYQVNVQYLEQVQPKDLDASEIEARLGATWILSLIHI